MESLLADWASLNNEYETSLFLKEYEDTEVKSENTASVVDAW
jgi:hypothetical protein